MKAWTVPSSTRPTRATQLVVSTWSMTLIATHDGPTQNGNASWASRSTCRPATATPLHSCWRHKHGGRPTRQIKGDKGGGKSGVSQSAAGAPPSLYFFGADVSSFEPIWTNGSLQGYLAIASEGRYQTFGSAVQQRLLIQSDLSRCVAAACQAPMKYVGFRDSLVWLRSTWPK